MKIFIRNESGIELEIEKISALGEGDIIIRTHRFLKKQDIEENEKELSKKFGRNVVILDGRIDEILTIPPVSK